MLPSSHFLLACGRYVRLRERNADLNPEALLGATLTGDSYLTAPQILFTECFKERGILRILKMPRCSVLRTPSPAFEADRFLL